MASKKRKKRKSVRRGKPTSNSRITKPKPKPAKRPKRAKRPKPKPAKKAKARAKAKPVKKAPPKPSKPKRAAAKAGTKPLSRKQLKRMKERLAQLQPTPQMRAVKQLFSERFRALRKKHEAAEAKALAPIQKLLLQLQQEQSEAFFQREFPGFVAGEDIEMLHRDGSIAVYPSTLRHVPQKDFDNIFKRLRAAGMVPTSRYFQHEAEQIAEQYDVPLKEVYTLWLSP